MCRRKLTLEQHDEIRLLLADGHTQRSLGKQYGVSRSVIGRIAATRPDGRSLWLYGYHQDLKRKQQRERGREERAEAKRQEQLRRECSVCGRIGRVPCVYCAAKRYQANHGLPGGTEPEEIALELPREEEERRRRLREGVHRHCS